MWCDVLSEAVEGNVHGDWMSLAERLAYPEAVMTGQPRSPFVAVDWGTSSLRVWLLAPDGTVMAEDRTRSGMDTVPAGGFETLLRDRLAALGVLDQPDRPLPIVLCGMVGARQGWREAGYLDAPASLEDLVDAATSVPVDGIDARILPGLARRDEARPDVMRGEETQLLGLVSGTPSLSGLVCMPGTHSKWVRLGTGRVADFATSITGELFALLAGHSILRHTIAGATPTGDPASRAFQAGLALGLAEPARLTADVFGIRAGGLLFGLSGLEAADRLSGLLIGAEIGRELAAVDRSEPVTLLATGTIAALYGAGFEAAGRKVECVDADVAVRAGLTRAAARFWPVF